MVVLAQLDICEGKPQYSHYGCVTVYKFVDKTDTKHGTLHFLINFTNNSLYLATSVIFNDR